MTTTINEVVELIPEWRGKDITIEPLHGGLTNNNFKINVNNSSFFISISGRNSQSLGVDWYNKFYNANICGEKGLSPQIIHHFPHHKVFVLEFLPFTLCSLESLHNITVQHRLVQAVKVLHNCASFWQDFDMFLLINFYMETIKGWQLLLPAEYAKYQKHIVEIGQTLAPFREKLVPCHNDLLPENLMDNGNQVFLLDFDYSGNNDPCFDLASIGVEAEYDNKQIRELASAYYGQVNEIIIARIHLHGILGDVGWALWSVIQEKISDIDFDFRRYGMKRWGRAVKQLESSELVVWLQTLT